MNPRIGLIFCFAIIFSFSTNAQTLNRSSDYSIEQDRNTTSNTGRSMTPVIPPSLPASMTFAGESVPLNRWEVRERLDRELFTNSFFHTSTTYILKLKDRYFPIIENILRQNGVPEDFKYLCVAESSLQNLTSPAGAKGFWQFLSATGKQYGLEVNNDIDERYHIEKSTQAACRYLKDAYNKFGNWTAAAASYNCGMGGYNSYSSYQGFTNYYELLLPEETNRYVFRIIALKMIMEQPEKYGFQLTDADKYKPVPTKKVTVNGGISDLAQWARSQGTTYKMVRLLNPWILGKSFSSSGKTYYIEVPTTR